MPLDAPAVMSSTTCSKILGPFLLTFLLMRMTLLWP